MLFIFDCNAMVTEMDMDSDDSQILGIAYVFSNMIIAYYHLLLHILHEV